jgi:hypothetical protein
VSEPRDDGEGKSPEAVLDYLFEHRQRVGRDKVPVGRRWPRGRKTTLLGIAAAVALAAAGALGWKVLDHGKPASRGAAETATQRTTAGAPSKGAATTPTTASGSGTAKKTPKDADAWHRGLHVWRVPTEQGLPDLYYGTIQFNTACSGAATQGCWKVTVVSRSGCPHGLVMIATERQDGRDVGATEGFSGPLAAKKRVVVELDLSRPHVRGRISSLGCVPGSP